MDIKDFKSGVYKKGFQYEYFLPEKINHSFVWSDSSINDLLEKAALKLGGMIKILPCIFIIISFAFAKLRFVPSLARP